MPHRLLRYNVNLWEQFEYKFPVISGVIYLLPEGEKPASPLIIIVGDIEIIRFPFMMKDFSQWTFRELLEREDPGLLPFFPLTLGGRERENLEPVLDKLYKGGEEHLLVSICGMVGLVFLHFTKAEPVWFTRKKESMLDQERLIRQVPLVRDFIQLGREEGLEEGHEKGLEEGREEIGREMLVRLVKVRFPDLDTLVRKQASLITSLTIIEDLHDRIAIAKDSHEARRYLLEWQGYTRTLSSDQKEADSPQIKQDEQ